jgi:hypothetical protein
MTNSGPVMANLKLDGILPHDVTTAKNREMAAPLVANSKMENKVVCNSGSKFTNGKLTLNFKNPSTTDMKLNLNFYHHHQLQIETPETEITIPAGSEKQIDISFHSTKPLDYDKIDLISTDWEIGYDGAENKNFKLQGKSQFVVQSTKETEKEKK